MTGKTGGGTAAAAAVLCGADHLAEEAHLFPDHMKVPVDPGRLSRELRQLFFNAYYETFQR